MDLKVHFPLNGGISQLPTKLSTPQIASQFLAKLQKLPNRSISFFDEIISGYIILTNKVSPVPSNNSYPKLIEALTKVSIEVSIQSSEYLRTARDRVQLKLLNISNDSSNIIYNGSIQDQYITIWKFEIPVSYPIKKIVQPKIIINVLVNIEKNLLEDSIQSSPSQDHISPTPSRNLLQGITSRTFNNDVNEPYLPESLITPMLPQPPSSKEEGKQQVQLGPMLLKAKFSLPVYPILIMRLKSAKLAGPSSSSNSVLLTLELSSSKDVFKIENLSVLVTKIELTLKDGEVLELFDKEMMKNLTFQNKNDTINLTFKLKLHSNFDNDLLKPLNIRIVTIPKISETSNLTNHIEMKWITNIDFEMLSNSKRRQNKNSMAHSRNVSSQNLANLQRKSELKLSLKSSSQILQPPPVPVPPPPQQTMNSLTGLKFTVYGVNKVKLGEIFHLNLQIINNTNKFTKLLILFNNESYLNESILEKKFPKLPTLSNTKSRSTVSLSSLAKDTSSMINSQLNLIRNYNLNKLRTTGIICMSNELRLDSLDPQSVYDLKIDIMAIRKGIYNLEGVKIIDMTTGESFECGKLLQVVVD